MLYLIALETLHVEVLYKSIISTFRHTKQEAQLMLTTGSTRLAVSRGQQGH